jgi:hypothetical protein
MSEQVSAFEKQAAFALYSELLFAARYVPMLEQAFGEQYDPASVHGIGELAVANEDFRGDLLEIIVEARLAVSAAWVGLLRPECLRYLVLEFARAGDGERLSYILAQCNFEGSQGAFPLAYAEQHGAELKEHPALLDAAFLSAAVLDCAGGSSAPAFPYLLSLGPSKEARLRAIDCVATASAPLRGELYKLLCADLDDAAVSAAARGQAACVVDIYYFVRNKAAVLDAIIAGEHWDVAQALVLSGHLAFEVCREQVGAKIGAHAKRLQQQTAVGGGAAPGSAFESSIRQLLDKAAAAAAGGSTFESLKPEDQEKVIPKVVEEVIEKVSACVAPGCLDDGEEEVAAKSALRVVCNHRPRRIDPRGRQAPPGGHRQPAVRTTQPSVPLPAVRAAPPQPPRSGPRPSNPTLGDFVIAEPREEATSRRRRRSPKKPGPLPAGEGSAAAGK